MQQNQNHKKLKKISLNIHDCFERKSDRITSPTRESSDTLWMSFLFKKNYQIRL